MKAIVIYKSGTGFTKKYAEWIGKELRCESLSVKEAKAVDLSLYDAVIYGGWVFAGSVSGFQKYREKLQSFQGKKAVFVVGAAPANIPQSEKILEEFFTREEQENMGIFYMQGGLDYAHMAMAQKLMMKMMCAAMKKEHGADSQQYKTISQSFDGTDKAAIGPLVDYITG